MRNADWLIGTPNGEARNNDDVKFALLMDIRQELRDLNHGINKLNNLLSCPNFTAIPATLRSIRRNTAKPREKK